MTNFTTVVSGSIIENTIIFPKSAVAFMVLPIREIASERNLYALDEQVVERLVCDLSQFKILT